MANGVGYLTRDGKLRKVPIEGGGSITLAEDAAPTYQSAAWLDDQTIVYVAIPYTLKRMPADGGASVSLSGFDKTGFVLSLWPLPGSRGFLFTGCRANCSLQSNIYLFAFGADSARLLVPRAAGAWFAPTGHLLYASRDGGLYAAAFDPQRLTLAPGAVPVIDGVDPLRFTLSASGDALYSANESGDTLSELVWVARDGRAQPFDSTWRGRFEYPALSPDGKSLAVSVRANRTDLWIHHADGTRQKIIADGVVNWRPSWMSDGQSLTFISIGNLEKNERDVAVYRARADGGAKAEPFLRQPFSIWESELSRDGQWVVIRSDEEGGINRLRARRLAGDTTLVLLITDQTYQLALDIALSPDGRWLAYTSNEAGALVDVYVASFPDMRSKRLVSRGGGTEPRWARSGRELFFQSGGHLMSVDVGSGPALTVGSPRALFSLAGYRRARNRQQYDVSPDGQRFVMIREAAGKDVNGAVYVENWLAELKAKVKR